MRWWPIPILLLAAAASAVNAFWIALENLMVPGWSHNDPLVFRTLGAIAVLAASGLVLPLALGIARARPWMLVLTGLIVVAGFVPRLLYDDVRSRRAAADAEYARQYEAELATRIAERRRDVETRAGAARPYSPDEAMEFMTFARNLGYRDAATRASVVAILQQALEGKVVDPNLIVHDRLRADLGPEPLFIHYHRWIRQRRDDSVQAYHWQMLLLLARAGADLTRPDAAPVAEDLRKTATPTHGGLYLDLK